MILDSSKDYFTGVVYISFDDSEPKFDELVSYCLNNYNFKPLSIATCDLPNYHKGFFNPGLITLIDNH